MTDKPLLEFKFLLAYAEPSTIEQPTHFKIQADSLREALVIVSETYGFVIDSSERVDREYEVWCTNPRDNKSMRYIVEVEDAE